MILQVLASLALHVLSWNFGLFAHDVYFSYLIDADTISPTDLEATFSNIVINVHPPDDVKDSQDGNQESLKVYTCTYTNIYIMSYYS